ncbi:hypothetical protein EDI_333930 [Entamoeba dispar SAW760]|uniref:Uncharacterized protein n=1 Tax=Entamoeba dispar (strain ATCC PRA-260 / SAW760) TaxID=370354 RepID=B0EJW6_ENTDS|nr:uncharacterized protein EDI_333930 [Entamoeba dispar SAW760]EDR25175.1 hypothetical protein EDI_333930 [Entamoeba dispar SAW760]|eukprot:EDR25175.1 hypothetical protein EDI_333930 [Entamoeba dispar SAW760]
MSLHNDTWMGSCKEQHLFHFTPVLSKERCRTDTPQKDVQPLLLFGDLEDEQQSQQKEEVRHNEADADKEVFDILNQPSHSTFVFRKSPIIRDDVNDIELDLPRNRCDNSLDPFFV